MMHCQLSVDVTWYQLNPQYVGNEGCRETTTQTTNEVYGCDGTQLGCIRSSHFYSSLVNASLPNVFDFGHTCFPFFEALEIRSQSSIETRANLGQIDEHDRSHQLSYTCISIPGGMIRAGRNDSRRRLLSLPSNPGTWPKQIERHDRSRSQIMA